METKAKIGIGAILSLMLLSAVGVAMYQDGSKTAKDVFYIVSSTEYWTGETGQIVARFVDFQGDPISVNNCSTSILYPNSTDFFVLNALMSTSPISGDHYYEFTVPEEEGIYDYSVECSYLPSDQRQAQSKTFHVSPALNEIKLIQGLNNTIVEIDGRLIEVNNTVQNIYTDTQDIRNNYVTQVMFSNNMTVLNTKLDDIDTNISVLMDYCSDYHTNNSDLCTLVSGIDTKIDAINTTLIEANNLYLQEINQTTHNTYDYVSGTLFSTLNTVLGLTNSTNIIVQRVETTVTEINNTVNTIDTTTNTILSNTSAILENQENDVNLNIVS